MKRIQTEAQILNRYIKIEKLNKDFKNSIIFIIFLSLIIISCALNITQLVFLNPIGRHLLTKTDINLQNSLFFANFGLLVVIGLIILYVICNDKEFWHWYCVDGLKDSLVNIISHLVLLIELCCWLAIMIIIINRNFSTSLLAVLIFSGILGGLSAIYNTIVITSFFFLIGTGRPFSR